MRKKNILLMLGIILILTGISAGQMITFDEYHSYKEITAYLKDMAAKFPKLSRLSSMGKSYLGKDLWILEITNRDVKKPEHKPAMYIDGGTHGNEVTGTEVCLHTIDYLLKHYGQDERITHLLDTRTIYIAPSVNPDSNDLFVTTSIRSLRNNQRPYDDDNDGKMDEDPSDDLNGDGFITMMRKKDPEEGTMISHPEDPRIMFRPNTEKGEKGVYKLWRSEGIDNDGDGEINEDGRGGVNINRNYPAYWQPAYKQARAGFYPLSESESRAIVEFLLVHPNIATVQSYHTSGGFLFQPLAADKASVIPEEDMAVFNKIAAVYKKATGNDTRRPYIEKGPRPGPHGYGIFIDWAYMHFGAYSGTTELWNLPDNYDPEKIKEEKDAVADDAFSREKKRTEAWFRFIDEEFDGEGFVPWTLYDHPSLGEVEIGGWKKFVRSNPPAPFLKDLVEKNTQADIAQAELTPLVVIKDIEITLVQGGQNPKETQLEETKNGYRVKSGKRIAGEIAIFEVKARVCNKGPVQSLTKKMRETSLPFRPNLSDLLIIEPGRSVRLLAENTRVRLGHLEAKDTGGDTKSASWLIQLNGQSGQIKIISHSIKGGVDERVVEIGWK